MVYFWGILISIVSIYAFLIFSFSFAWKKLKVYTSDTETGKQKPFISVVIALRNEALNVSQLIHALKDQNYEKNQFEVILIDDHSTDGTFEKIKAYSNKNAWLSAFQQIESYKGKKEALQFGISKAKGEIISFTDADCLPPRNWLKTLSSFYIENNQPDMIIGLLQLDANNFLQKIFKLEFVSILLSSAGAAALGNPILCNGANLCVRSASLKNYNFQNKITSGDDVFLLHYLKKKKAMIKVLKSPDHIVKTSLPASFLDFLNQRNRWASKSLFYKDPATISLAILVFLVNLALLASLIAGFVINNFAIIASLFILKSISDLTLIISGKDTYHYQNILWWIPFISFLYPFYIVLTALSSIKRPFQWKGRKYTS